MEIICRHMVSQCLSSFGWLARQLLQGKSMLDPSWQNLSGTRERFMVIIDMTLYSHSCVDHESFYDWLMSELAGIQDYIKLTLINQTLWTSDLTKSYILITWFFKIVCILERVKPFRSARSYCIHRLSFHPLKR